MCGITGVYYFDSCRVVENCHLEAMINKILYRGPDECKYYINKNFGCAFSRLSIIDLENGTQPMFNIDRSIISICNGEIFNYKELKQELSQKGHHFSTDSDMELIIPLYLEYGLDFFNKINGQFALMVFDKNNDHIILARDHFGICPLYYTITDRTLIFASEIKAILEHPLVKSELDLIGLDQVFTFPGLISPRTMFKNINSMQSGHFLQVNSSFDIKIIKYWDYNFSKKTENIPDRTEDSYIEELDELFTRAVALRLRADVSVGAYLSGGLDSSLVLANMRLLLGNDAKIMCISADFDSKYESEGKYQKYMAEHFDAILHTCLIGTQEISSTLQKVIYHSECPVKETFNVASFLLSSLASKNGLKVVLAGQGADELFGGYVGYLFDLFGPSLRNDMDISEQNIQSSLWGEKNFVYEKKYHAFENIKRELYSEKINTIYNQISCITHPIIEQDCVESRSPLARRSYIDLKLRLADHLLSDHGDRMAMANAVEVRYPFLDINVVNFAMKLPDKFKVNAKKRKYIVNKLAKKYLPDLIINREKQGFSAPGSPDLLRNNIEYINDILSYNKIKSQGYFNPSTIESLKLKYISPNYRIKVPFESDLMITVLTMGIFLDLFKISAL